MLHSSESFLNLVTPKAEWIVKEKAVFNVDTGKTEKMQFLYLNQIYTYNYGMGDIDIADQLRLHYHMDHWLRNRKWWWSILFWALGVILPNSYILYTKLCDKEEVPKKNRYTHYKFLREVGMYWMNPKYMEKKGGATIDCTKGLFSPSASSISSISVGSSKKSQKLKERYMTDSSFGPNGEFNWRLYDAKLYFPENCVNVKCQKQEEAPQC